MNAAALKVRLDVDAAPIRLALDGLRGKVEEASEQLARERRQLRARLLAAFVLGAVLGALLTAAAPAWGEEPGSTVEVLAGAGVTVSEESDVIPVAKITVDAPVYLGRSSAARIRAALQVNGAAGQTLDLADVQTFRGAELDVEIERRIGQGPESATYLLLKVGGAARRDASVEGTLQQPRDRFPGWWGAGVAIEHRGAGAAPDRRLVVTWGASQLCHDVDAAPRDLIVTGQVTVAQKGGAVLAIAGDIHRPLWGDGRSVFRLAALAGWGSGS